MALKSDQIGDNIPSRMYQCIFCEQLRDEQQVGIVNYQACFMPKVHSVCMECFSEIAQVYSAEQGACPFCSRNVSEIRSLEELKLLISKKQQIEKKIHIEINRTYEIFLPLALESVKAKYAKGASTELTKASLSLAEIKKAMAPLTQPIVDPEQLSRHEETIQRAHNALTQRNFAEAEALIQSLIPAPQAAAAQSDSGAYAYVTYAVNAIGGFFSSIGTK